MQGTVTDASAMMVVNIIRRVSLRISSVDFDRKTCDWIRAGRELYSGGRHVAFRPRFVLGPADDDSASSAIFQTASCKEA